MSFTNLLFSPSLIYFKDKLTHIYLRVDSDEDLVVDTGLRRGVGEVVISNFASHTITNGEFTLHSWYTSREGHIVAGGTEM